MNGKTLIFLVALVGGLLWFTQQQQQSEQQQELPYRGALIPGFQKQRVVELRWEHVERNRNVACELRSDGWHMTDPRAVPAAADRVQLVLDGLETGAVEVPASDREAVASHFDPPRAILTVFTQSETGAREEHVVELGALDVDPMLVEARFEGRLLRINRNLDTALRQSIPDLRRKQVFEMSAARLMGIERFGTWFDGVRTHQLAFQARREGPYWIQYKPTRVQLDPTAMAIQMRVLAAFQIETYVSDLPDPALDAYGLVQPEMGLVLIDSEGNRETLHLSQNLEGAWFGKIEGKPNVYGVDEHMMSLVTDDWKDLRDHALVRAMRADVETLTLSQPDGKVRFRQSPALDGPWTVAFQPDGATEFSAEWPADRNKVEDLLGALEQNLVVLWADQDPGLQGELFSSGHPLAHVEYAFRNSLQGEIANMRFGQVVETSEGTPLLAVRRGEDSQVGLVSTELVEILSQPSTHWRSVLLWELVEHRLEKLRLSRGASERVFLRKPQGTWRFEDVDATPTALLPALDHLIYLKADTHLASTDASELLDPVRVEFHSRGGAVQVAEIGRAEDGSVQARVRGHRAIIRHTPLLEMLEGLLQGN